MICIECTHPVSSLYTQYSASNIRSTSCPNCHKFADKYIEFDSVVTTIDLLLLRPQAFRHVVFNVLSPNDDYKGFHRQTWRMWLLVTLFDVYLRWATTEKGLPISEQNEFILSLAIPLQYCIFLIYCIVDTLIMQVTIRFMASRWLNWKKPDALSTAVVVSSSSKLFPVLMLIWTYDIPIAATVMEWAVDLNTIEVLAVIIQCGYIKAATLTIIAVWLKKIACKLVKDAIVHGLVAMLKPISN